MKIRVRSLTTHRIASLVVTVGLVLGALVVAPDGALADTDVFRDPDEGPGCLEGCPDKDFMDFRRLRQGHGDFHRRVMHGIRTVKPWKTRALGETGVTIEIWFDTDADHRSERVVVVRRRDGRLRADMYRARDYHRLPVNVRVWRPSRYSVRVRFSAAALKDDLRTYGWRVTWSRNPDGDGYEQGVVYWDSAPDQDWYIHRL